MSLSFQRMSTVANKSNRQVKDLAKPMECRTLKSGMGAPTTMPRGISTSNGSVADEYGLSKKFVMQSVIWLLRDLPLTAWAFVNPSFHTGSQSCTILPCTGASGTVAVQVGRSQEGSIARTRAKALSSICLKASGWPLNILSKYAATPTASSISGSPEPPNFS